MLTLNSVALTASCLNSLRLLLLYITYCSRI